MKLFKRKTMSAVLLFCSAAAVQAAPVMLSAAGANGAAIQATVDAFRASLGALNPNVAGSSGSGRREINWDGVPDALSSPNNLPFNFFNSNSPRGVQFATPGTGFQVSANAVNPSAAPVEFGNIEPSYPGIFSAFSAQRLFTALGSNIVDVGFFIPGALTAALTSGFGAVFTDVDLPDTTSIEFFDTSNASLGRFFVPAATGDGTLSFLGVRFSEGSVVSRVRISSGNQILAPRNTANDLVAMDDFIYAEPVLQARPLAEPPVAWLVLPGLAGLLGVAAIRRSSGSRSADEGITGR